MAALIEFEGRPCRCLEPGCPYEPSVALILRELPDVPIAFACAPHHIGRLMAVTKHLGMRRYIATVEEFGARSNALTCEEGNGGS